MKQFYHFARNIIFLGILTFYAIAANGQSFSASDLKNATLGNPTSLQFGPDGKLYVSQQNGTVWIYTIKKNGPNDYEATSSEKIELVRFIPLHNDDGTPFTPSFHQRLCTGLLVAGTASNPVIYVTSSDYRFGAGEKGDVNLCTNSGIISKLYKEGGTWKKIDLVRGLPRSEENHAPNGMQIYGNKLLVAIGGFTNSGAPSRLWTYITEYALASCILQVDLDVIEAMPTKMDPTGKHPYKYDIPTLDDPTRPNNPDGTDVGDPWGGNDGLNQAKIIPGGPVKIFATGFRNAYDVLITKNPSRPGRVYSVDNAPNGNWGGYPPDQNDKGTVTNKYDESEPGSFTVRNFDGLHYIGDINNYTLGSYYAGHPVPIRANPSGAGLYTDDGTHRGWRNDNSNPNLPLPSDWPPVPPSMANPQEGLYLPAALPNSKGLIHWKTSTNGICEYLYSGNGMYGDLLTIGMDGRLFRIKLDANGNVLNPLNNDKMDQDPPLASGFGNKPLDVVSQGDADPYPGTIWFATWGANKITILEPQNIICNTSDPNGDADNDCYTNKDEIDNGTNPCNASSKPEDFDKDCISDRNDPDDDNDGILDVNDKFAIDDKNGLETEIPTHYHLFNYDPGTGFFGLGFTGLMINNQTDYLDQYEISKLIAGGAVGAFTITEVTTGDAYENLNNQEFAMQFGVNVHKNSGVFTVKSGILPMYFNQQTPSGHQSQGIFIGNGDQDNYIKIALNSNGGAGGIQIVKEVDGIVTENRQLSLPNGIPNSTIAFFLTVDPEGKTVTPRYQIGTQMYGGGTPISLEGKLLDVITDHDKALAVGVIATSRGGSKFSATWDYIEVYPDVLSSTNKWSNKAYEGTISIFPNPGKDKVTINITAERSQKLTLKVFNSLGHQIHSENIKVSAGSNESNMDVSKFTEGVYFFQFSNEKENSAATLKLIKN
ncbi:MAG: T9SS type A sorting domain-containing protein [Cytophagaceae bacterium]